MAATLSERAGYRPLRHPGPRNRWSPEAILEALRTWVQETGRPPRRQDWTGERPGRAGDAQRKWMREHPRWPSSSCVASHFGTWSAALERAALPARRLTFPSSVSERVRAARELAAEGRALDEIAARLGVSRASAHNYLHARDCPDCGAPVTSPTAQRCRECMRHRPTVERSWTPEEAAAALREWTERHGRPPRYREWTPNRERPGRWERESPRWPSAAVVCALLGPWSDAVRTGVYARTGPSSPPAARPMCAL